MQKNKKTRRCRKVPKKYTHNKKSYKKRSRKYGRYKGGLNKTDTAQITELKKVISEYMKITPEESPKYKKLQEDIDTYNNTLSTKDVNDLTENELEIIQRLAIRLIGDDTDFLTKIFKPAYKLINSIVLYFINDIELIDNTEFILKKRITNKMPYLDVIRRKDGSETTYNVDEMFQLIKSEMNESEYSAKLKDSILKKLTINSKFGLEPVIPPSAPGT
jgi:hypothetical protein